MHYHITQINSSKFLSRTEQDQGKFKNDQKR